MGNDTVISDSLTAQLEAMNRQVEEILLAAERRRRKVLRPDLNFSDKVKFWHERVNAWRALLN